MNIIKIIVQTKTDSQLHEVYVDDAQILKYFEELPEKYQNHLILLETKFMYDNKELNKENSWSKNGIKENMTIDLYFVDNLNFDDAPDMSEFDVRRDKLDSGQKPMMRMPINLLGGGGGYTF